MRTWPRAKLTDGMGGLLFAVLMIVPGAYAGACPDTVLLKPDNRPVKGEVVKETVDGLVLLDERNNRIEMKWERVSRVQYGVPNPAWEIAVQEFERKNYDSAAVSCKAVLEDSSLREVVKPCVYRMLAIHLGEPPREFLWQWRNKDKEFHRHGVITPSDFYRKYVGFDLDSMTCLIHCPTADKPFGKMYTIDYLGNVVEGDIIRYLNIEMDIFKAAAVEMLKAGKPVWFGCDVGKMLERDLGILDSNLYDYSSVYGAPFRAGKGERIDYGHSVMTHAMVLTGVDLDDAGKPRKWRVENSWGEKIGAKGYMVMTDSWFDEYLYEIAVDKQFLPAELLPVLKTDPVRLPPWDPMGSLATSARLLGR